MARIYIVRHGETNENNQRIIQGQLNTHLNDEGREQARLVADALKDVEFHAAYSSDLERASDTAKAILLHHPGVELVEQQELRERNMGDIQGRVYNHELFGTWLKAEANIESTAAFAARGLDWWVKHVVQKVPHGPYNVLVTSHGAFIGGLVKNLINSKKILCGNSVVIKTLCDNCSISIIEIEENGVANLIQYSGNDHLRKEKIVDNVDELVDAAKPV